jgi:hypothetical protein
VFLRTHGRSCSCLLAMLFLILTPASLRAQSDSASPTPDFSFPITPPNVPLLPIVGPTGEPVRPPTTQPPIFPRPIFPRPIVPPPIAPSPVSPPGTFGLTQLTQAAGTIFSGTVTAVVHHPATGSQGIATVAITFHVEQAIRGVIPGQNLTILQWMGLWSGGQRYRVGERLLLFLYPASKLGLTSCVGGSFGRFSVDPWGRVFFSAQHLSAFRTDPVLGGKAHVTFRDFALAVQQAQSRIEE